MHGSLYTIDCCSYAWWRSAADSSALAYIQRPSPTTAERLPTAEASVPPDGLRLEFGGRLSGDMFTRVHITYSSGSDGGRLRHISFEDFTNQQ